MHHGAVIVMPSVYCGPLTATQLETADEAK